MDTNVICTCLYSYLHEDFVLAWHEGGLVVTLGSEFWRHELSLKIFGINSNI